MLRKLIFSVLVLSLMLAFAGTAFAGNRVPDASMIKGKVVGIADSRPAPVSGLKTIDLPQNAKTFTVTEQGVDYPYPSPYAPDHGCEFLDLIDYSSSAYYSFDLVDGDAGLQISNRFENPEYHSAVVYGAAVRIYDMSAAALDLNFYVWDDNGSVPGNLLYTWTVPAATIAANGPGHWLFSAPVAAPVPGSKYHISYDISNSGNAADYITFGIAQNGDGGDNGTSYASFDGISWMTLTDLFGGFPLNARLSSDVCYVYSSCNTTAIGSPSWFGLGLPSGSWAGMKQTHEVARDTLKTVHINHLVGPGLEWSLSSQTNTMIVEIWADDGTGWADVGAGPLATRTISGTANLFPGGEELVGWSEVFLDVDFSADNLVLTGFFHASWRMSNPDPATGIIFPLLEPGYGGGGYVDDLGGGVLDVWNTGAGHGMTINVTTCKDEYAECQTQILYAGGFASAFGMGGNVWTVAQQVKGNPDNRVEGMRVFVADEQPWGGLPGDNEGTVPGNPDLRLNIYYETLDIYGDLVPGAVAWDLLIPGASVNANGWTNAVIPDVLMANDFWVGYELVTVDSTFLDGAYEWWNASIDLGPFDVNSGAWLFYEPWQEWISTQLFGIPANNWLMQVDFCSIPVVAYPCGIEDWGTLQGNYQRTGHSSAGIGDAQCTLTLDWAYPHPAGLYSQYTTPIIYDNTIVNLFRSAGGSEYKTFDLQTKVEGYTILASGNPTAVPTVHAVDGAAAVMFVTGGTSDEIVMAVDFASGAPLYTISTTGLGAAIGMSAGETNPYGNFIVANDPGTGLDVLYFSTDIGKIYAVYAATGAPFWAGPFIPTGFGSVSNRTGTYDGSENLFYAYAAVVGGDIVSIAAVDGTINWQLSSGALTQGNVAYGGGVAIEQFQAGMSYDILNDALYAVSSCSGPHPIAGVLYQLSGSTGALINDAQPCNGINNTMTPVQDQAFVILPMRAVWVNGPNAPYSIQTYRKSDLTFSWGVGWGASASDDFGTSEILMTCEDSDAQENDLIFMFSRNGMLQCIDGTAGVSLFHRRIADDVFGGAGGALAYDALGVGHLVFSDAAGGGLYDLTAGVSRSRLEVRRGNTAETSARGEVPFGNDLAYPVTFTSVYANTGCEDLTGSGTITLTSNGIVSMPYRAFGEDFGSGDQFGVLDNGYHHPFKSTEDYHSVDVREYDGTNAVTAKATSNPAALALGFINNEIVTIAAGPDGADVDVTVEVDQAAVGRGVFPRFLEFTTTNDPDYWLDTANHNAPPEVMITFLGGCVMEYESLLFGAGEANEQVVFNSGRLVENGVGDFTIDGVSGVNFQAYYLFGVSDHALAFTIVSWLEGSGETSTWNGWLPDLLAGECAPLLVENIQLGPDYIESDGVTTGPIMGNTVAYNSIDSVQDFTDAGEPDGWNHANFIAPFSNTLTMGLAIEHLTVGAVDFATTDGSLDDIGNATIEFFNFTERNGNPVTGWKMGAYLDWDCRTSSSGVDTTRTDRSSSLSWTYDNTISGARVVGGQIKIPFNYCSDTEDAEYLAPLKNSIAMDQAQGMWGSLGGGGNDVWFLDSAYYYFSLPWDSAEYSQELPADEDQAGAYTLVEHDFTGGDSFKMAVANFQFQNYATPLTAAGRMSALAHTLNKWCGFGRGDVNNDNVINLMDVVYLSNAVAGGPKPYPFEHLGDVNVSGGAPDLADVRAIADFYFCEGGCFGGEWTM